MSDKYPWSEYQKQIFKNIAEEQGHLVVDALAGSGKTSVIIESLEYIPIGKSWLLIAFNKRIADELKKRAPVGGDTRTLHSLGLRAIYKKFPDIRIVQEKVDKILNKTVGKEWKHFDIKIQIKKTVGLCKAYLIDGAEMIDFIMDNHDIDTFDLERKLFIEKVQATLKECATDTKTIDFDDMIWFPYMHNISLQRYHFVFADEAQDLNNAQINLVIKACKRNGRIIAIGDKNQACYKFRGASSNAISTIKARLQAKSLPLSITYRCPHKVVQEAQKYVPHLEAAPDAEEGIVDYITPQQMVKDAKPGCFILSRTNAPMIGYALDFIRNGIPASIQGRDIGANLIALIKKSRKKDLDDFIDWLDGWERKEIGRLLKKNRTFDHIKDKASCLRAVADGCSNLSFLKSRIMELFEDTDDHDRIILSSTHKSKGLERDVIYMLTSTFGGGDREETNLRYIAISRSKRELYYVA